MSEMKYPKYELCKFSDDKTAQAVRGYLIKKLGKGISAIACYDTVEEIEQNVREDLQ